MTLFGSRVGLPVQANFLRGARTANIALPSTTTSWHTNQAGLPLVKVRVRVPAGRGGRRQPKPKISSPSRGGEITVS